MNRGKFITLEGGEGVGKSTQARLLAEALKARGIDVVVTREPGGTPLAERIRELLLDTQGERMNLRAEALLFAAARSEHVDKLIEPSLAGGRWVVCDRYVDSNRAYQGGEHGLPDDEIMALHRMGSGGLLPDTALLIEVAPHIAAERAAKRDAGAVDRIGGRDAAYHAGVAREFRRIATEEPDRFATIDGNGTVNEIHARIVTALEPLLEQAP